MDAAQAERRIAAMQHRIDQLSVEPYVNEAELAATYGSLLNRYATSDVELDVDDAAYIVEAHDYVGGGQWTRAEQVLADYAADVALHPDETMDGVSWTVVEEDIEQLQTLPLPDENWRDELVRYRVALGLHGSYDT